MAFNWQTFRTRALTAIIFVVVMLAGLLWNRWSFLVLFSIIHFGCWWEYLKLTEKIHQTFFHPYIKLGFMLIGYGLMLWFCGQAYQINGYGLKENFSLPVSAAGFALMIMGIFQKAPIKLKSFGAAALGLLYISMSWGFMMDLYEFTVYKKVAETIRSGLIVNGAVGFFIIGCMWINDTMAYIVGSLIGKTPFSKISPKKTWEGTIGGIILCTVIMGFVMHDFMYRYYSLTVNSITQNHWYTIAAIAAIAGTFGDLLESKLKRMAGVKDSGSLMPGHGGFLDRFDSLLLATPFVWVYVNLFMR
jgi:phosphatidate cytidylyltransferase